MSLGLASNGEFQRFDCLEVMSCLSRSAMTRGAKSSCRAAERSGCAVQDVAMTLGLGTLISRHVLVPRHVSPRRVNENILHSCSKRAFTWRNEVTSVSVFNIVVA